VTVAEGVVFRRVRDVAELDAAILEAARQQRPVMLDFYADWCVSCHEMEHLTFTDPAVRERLARAALLQADVTAHTAADQALLKRFGLFGPPGILFFDAQGHPNPQATVIGFQNAERFLKSLQAAGL
jgi:thiol:disulfide interchange protein DsbD